MHGHTGRSLRRRWLSKTVDTNEVAKSAVELCRPSVFASQPDRVPKRVRRAGVPWKRHAGKGGALLKDCNADAAIRNHDRRLSFKRDLLRGCQSGCREPEHCEPEAEHRNHYPLQSGVGTGRTAASAWYLPACQWRNAYRRCDAALLHSGERPRRSAKCHPPREKAFTELAQKALLAVIHALQQLGRAIRPGRERNFKLDDDRKAPLVVADRLQDLFDRRITLAKRHIRPVMHLPVLHMNVRDTLVILLYKRQW